MEIIFIALFLALALLSSYNKTKIKTKTRTKTSLSNNKNTSPPEAPGAWPFIGHLHLLGGRVSLPRKLGAMADTLGPIFSLRLGGRPAVVVSSAEMVKECFTTNDIVFSTRPSLAMGKYMGYNNALFSLAPYGAYWRELRKLVTLELLTSSRVEKRKNVRASELNSFMRNLYSLYGEKSNTPVDLSKWLEHLTLNISLRLLAGKRISHGKGNREENATIERLEAAVKEQLYLSGVFIPSDEIPALEWLDIGRYVKRMKWVAKEVDRVLTIWLEEHIQKMEEEEEDKDFMDVMLSTLPEDLAISSGHKRKDIIKATIINLILTASESTSVTIIWTLSLLLNNPGKLKLVQDELDAKVGKDRLVDESDIENLTYLRAVVKETLRLYPPGPLAGPRVATDDCRIGKFHVAKGTRLVVNLWKLHRDPRVWSEPEEFKPERFLGTGAHAGVNFVGGQDFEYIPFSGGRRMCPAMTFGLQVVHVTLARLLHGFQVSTPLGMPVDMTEGLGIAFPKVTPLDVLLTPRLPVELYPDF